MTIYPAVDIQDGKCVMLRQGKAEKSTVYGNDPIEVALKWEQLGAKYIHIVDLDGAIYGEDRGNLAVIQKMRKKLAIPMQVGGGLRDREKIEFLLDDVGIDRVIIGTLAIENTQLLKSLVRKYKEKIVVSIDAKDGMVATKGWTKESNVSAAKLCSSLKELGVETIVYTDIAKDGMLQGPNIEFAKKLIDDTKLNIIVAGGVTDIDDVKEVESIGAAGAILGKGLYDGRIDLKTALEAIRRR